MSACPMCRFDQELIPVHSWSVQLTSGCPTQNSLKGNTRTNHTYRGWRSRWEKLLADNGVPTANCPRRVTITRLYGKGRRPYDRVNFAGGCKPLLDTLVNLGLLYDDSALWTEDHYLQVRSPDGVDRVHILIEQFQ